jgi:antirestriction protein ArdC
MSEMAAGTSAPIILTAENQRDRLKEIIDKLETGIKGIFESEQYKTYLKTLSKFHNYSFNNCILIAMQKPDATYVAGFNSWRDNFKRNVMKGEKGIKILAPSPYKIHKEMECIDPKSGSVIKGKDGKSLTEEVEITVPAFRVVNVFDISQTDGEPLPELGVNELTGDVEQYTDLFLALEKSSPVPIAVEDIASGAKGYYEQVEKRIALNAGMSELQTLKTAIHEIAHARLHDIDKNAPKDVARPDHDTREVEAESVAYTVCQHYGLDTSDYSFGYIAGWSSAKELATLKQSLETIRTEAGAIITEVNGHMAQLAKDREAEVMQGLADETKATLQMFVDDDMARGGRIRQDTLEAIRVQGYQYKDGQLTKAAVAPPPVPESPIKAAEMSTEQNLNMIDGVLNNQPTVAEIEAKARSGKVVSLHELATAIKAERAETRTDSRRADDKPSIREQLADGKKGINQSRAAAPQRAATKSNQMEV